MNNVCERIARRVASTGNGYFNGRDTIYADDIYDFGVESGKHVYVYDAMYTGYDDLYRLVVPDDGSFSRLELYRLADGRDYYPVKNGEKEPVWKKIGEGQMPSLLDEMVNYYRQPIDFYDLMDIIEKNGFALTETRSVTDGSGHGDRYILEQKRPDADYGKMMDEIRSKARHPEMIVDGGDAQYVHAPEIRKKTFIILYSRV